MENINEASYHKCRSIGFAIAFNPRGLQSLQRRRRSVSRALMGILQRVCPEQVDYSCSSRTLAQRLISSSRQAATPVVWSKYTRWFKNSDGTMGMNLVTDPVEIPAGGQLELKDGGMHIMCVLMMAKEDLFKVGSKINLTLAFEKSGEKTVSFDIRDK